jgi:NADH-quinone oxidoreductase subunit H
MDLLDFSIMAIKAILLLVAVIQVVPVMIWVERKGAALIQDRPGPNRVGPFGLFQPLADALKFIFKEDPIPTNANKFLFALAPFLGLLPACMIIAVLPFADKAVVMGREVLIQVTDLNVGIVYMLAISSLGVYGILFGGWASNNKFSLVGALRASSQIISYEIPMGLAAAGAVTVFGTFSLREIAVVQEGMIAGGFLPNWGVFYQPIGFILFFICAFAETNRLPFDLPETEAELVGGFHTEYGSMKFAVFFMAEYMNLATISGLMTTLYFGAWKLPYISDALLLTWLHGSVNLLALIQFTIFIAKVSVFMLIFVWVRWTIPRFRFDQLMRLAWGSLIPIGLVNLFITAVVLYFAGRA